MSADVSFHVRPGRATDGEAFLGLVRALAAFEKLAPPDAEACARLLADAFGPAPRFQLLCAEAAGEVVAYAVYFFTYSTFLARPTLYLEDLFVHPDRRGAGIGQALMRALSAQARAHGCGRFEWTVLDWNTPAQGFYRALGASVLDEWRLCRADALAIAALAADG